MNAGNEFIECVKKGSTKPFVSLQIGAGAGFDVKLAGKQWNSQGTLDDTIRAYEIVGGFPLFNIGLPGLEQLAPDLPYETENSETEGEKFTNTHLETPFGQLDWKFHELPKIGTMIMKYPVTVDDNENAFNMIKWFADQHYKYKDRVADKIQPDVDKLKNHGPVSLQWNIQPFELFGLTSVDNLVLLAKLYPEQFRQTCDHIRDINAALLEEVFKTDVDFVFLGAPGSEMLSPEFYEKYIIPDSQKLTDVVHGCGRLIYSHICSPIEPFLTMGFYNQMGLDLFETFSPPPVGNVESIEKAREIMDDNICTRGNIGLDLLLNGSKEQVAQATLDLCEATKGTKHMIAASDYLFYDIPLENVQTMVETAENFK
ncbi:uroporphyrinogen decarboxylase family protein [Sedimentisphaera salicampi]|uniref:Methylcobalamin:coenzyme M methyltransferase n=1 Tax=Sedimentisphaera salicampi TaxID=1941349 RepID=A0A1W6LMU1_9BACT|nr:uroporphyrinogen decarboxylase family protein [Sedimentisphaera salicampi]ARN57066.1 methylcobalamin:coenzyme M methyltransferase [Sedimentisphaera salicampi]OXU14905.1 methylcobalamin:coenzyme M methyltransferase [Sedimentisphaera salicampi]